MNKEIKRCKEDTNGNLRIENTVSLKVQWMVSSKISINNRVEGIKDKMSET